MTAPQNQSTGRHASPDPATAPRSTAYPILVTVPIAEFAENIDYKARIGKVTKALAAVVRSSCGVDVSVGQYGPNRYMSDEAQTNTWLWGEFSAMFTNVTREDMEGYRNRMTAALTGRNRTKLLDGPEYSALTAEPIVEFPSLERLRQSEARMSAKRKVNADREANGGSLHTASAAAAKSGTTGGGPSTYDDTPLDDLF
jgi:hypothetical protein